MASVSSIRAKGQVTIPSDIRSAARITEGTPVEFSLVEGGILMKPKTLVDADQAWFWSDRWQKGEIEADGELAAGRPDKAYSGQEFIELLEERDRELDG